VKERTLLVVVLLTALLVVAGIWVAQNVNLMPAEASTRATLVDQLFRAMLGLAAVIFLLVEGLLLYSVFRFRRPRGDDGDAVPVHGNRALEIVWTLIPALIVVVIGFYSFRVLAASEIREADPLVVNVRSRQFAWTFEYPGSNVISSDLHLPVGRQVRFLITSDDVIHSFWVPEFRVKRDATPGQIAELLVTPTREGTYAVRCAELCGVGHAGMGLSSSAIVESAEAFQAWLTQAASLPADPIEAGRTLFTRYGCPACHALADAGAAGVVGPALDSLADPNGPHAHAHGSMDIRAFVEQSILEPSAAISPGFADGLMPQDFSTRVPANELAILVDYLVAQK
jgi:cytochrome c oxidase subunit 2